MRTARQARTPLNIHLTGCHHSCAQHYIGDIGLIAAKVDVDEDVDTIEGYHLVPAAALVRTPIWAGNLHDVKAEERRRRWSGC